jgi:hypothetical protein
MKKMIADMKFTYDRKDIKPGDELTVSDNDSLALRVYGRAHFADDADQIEPKKTRAKRTYKRRDMTAESH